MGLQALGPDGNQKRKGIDGELDASLGILWRLCQALLATLAMGRRTDVSRGR